MVQTALAPLGVEVTGAHGGASPEDFEAILVGGGNTFQLLRECRRRGVLESMGQMARAGTPYAGWSAGANLSCPTIRTTNDMPIVDPGGFDALGLIDFQINPHFTNAMPTGHQGETREQRLLEFVAANPGVQVLGVPEGDWVRVAGDRLALHGPKDAVWIRHGRPMATVSPGSLPEAFRVA
jgi:dipeptidase E